MHYMDIVTGALMGLLLFFSCIYSYTTGLKHGKQLSNNQVPTVNLNPVKAVLNAVEEHKDKKEAEKLNNDLDILLNTTKESMLDSIAKGVK